MPKTQAAPRFIYNDEAMYNIYMCAHVCVYIPREEIVYKRACDLSRGRAPSFDNKPRRAGGGGERGIVKFLSRAADFFQASVDTEKSEQSGKVSSACGAACCSKVSK